MEVIDKEIVKIYPHETKEEKGKCVWSDLIDRYILKDEAIKTVGGYWVHEDDGYVYCEDADAYAHTDDAWYCNFRQEWYYYDDYQGRTVDGEFIHTEYAYDHDYRYLSAGDYEGSYEHCDDVEYCEDIDGYVRDGEGYWCDTNDCYYYNEENVHQQTNDYISAYSKSPAPSDLSRGEYREDFAIGFEVEKTEFVNTDGLCADSEGDYVGEYDLFKGFETDSSCGVEAITHILPLGSPRSKSRKYVFDMIDDADNIINSPYNKSCGGHITISVRGIDQWDLVEKIRGNMGLMYGMYRWRLRRSYVYQNKKMEKQHNAKYSPVNVKWNCIEIRLPSAVSSAKQLKLRYDFMYRFLHHSLRTRGSFEQLLDSTDHILMRMYNRDRHKVNDVKDMARRFRKYILNDEIDSRIEYYLERQED